MLLRTPAQQAAYARALAYKMEKHGLTIWAAASGLYDSSFLAEWKEHGPKEWFMDLTVPEQILFVLFVAEALESEAAQ